MSIPSDIVSAWTPALPRNWTGSCLSAIWSEWFWFRVGLNWSDMENKDAGFRYPRFDELKLGLFMTVILLVLRYLMEKYIFNRLALVLGLRYSRKAERVTVLDQYYRRHNKQPSSVEIDQLVTELRWTARRIHRWFRLRRNEDQCKVKKFRECAWRLFFYVMIFLYGLYVLYDEPWAWSPARSPGLDTWPHHHVKMEFIIYYMVELGYYGSLLFSLHSDVHRSDFLAQALHHFAAVILIAVSWTGNFIRIGTLVLSIHNVADIWLQITKIAIYLKNRKMETIFTAVFTLVWVYSRLYVYPVYLIIPTWIILYETWHNVWPLPLFLISFLTLLQCLHVFWTWLIVKTIYRSVQRGGVRDARSDADDDSDDNQSN